MDFKYYIKAIFCVFYILGFAQFQNVGAQEILNITEIPIRNMEYSDPEEISIMDNRVVVPICGLDNDIYKYLPGIEIDSFPTPNNIFSTLDIKVKSTFYVEYEPFQGFIDKYIVNYNNSKGISVSGDYLGYAGTTRYFGLNNSILYEHPDVDTFPIKRSFIAVYDTQSESYVFVNEFAQNTNYNVHSKIDGDFIYVNIALSWEDDEDLVFMGDTLTYQSNPYWGGSNYLSKINYRTGVKEWTRHIGYGDVQQIYVDDKERITIEVESDAPAMFNFEWEDLEYSGRNGRYDRIIYRMDAAGIRIGHTYLQNHFLPSFDLIDFNSDGSFQAFGLVQTPDTIFADGIPFDFVDAVSPEQSKGLLLVFDENMNLKWGKKIISEGATLLHAGNRTYNDEYIIAVNCTSKSIMIDGQSFQAPALPPTETSLRQSILIRLNKNGDLLGRPVFTNNNIRIKDIQTIEEDHYLLNFVKYGDFSLEFINTIFDGDNIAYIVEYRGDIFDVVNSINQVFDESQVKVHPNLVRRGCYLSLEFPEDLLKADNDINLISLLNNNRSLTTVNESESKMSVEIPMDVTSGFYYLNIKSSIYSISKPIIIH